MDINDIISGLTDEDMENLRNMASGLFASQDEKKSQNSGMPDFSEILGNAELIGKLGKIMNAMRKDDDRVKFIGALKPLLSEDKQKRADDAMQLLRILDVIPLMSTLS